MQIDRVERAVVRKRRKRGPPRTAAGGDPPLPGLVVLVTLAALALTGAPTAAGAQGHDTPSLTFDGFGTLGVVYSTEDRADYVGNTLQPDGAGRSKEVSPEVDSRLGGQLTASLTPKLTAVVQVLVEQRAGDDYTPRLEWANVRYAFTPEFSVRAGRIALPVFMVSDFRKVSYANPWIRPPVELYSLVPVFTLDGVDATYRLRLGNWNTTLNANFGRSEAEFPAQGEEETVTSESENAAHLNATFQRGGLTGRMSVGRGELDIDAFDPFFDAFRQFGPEGEAVADRFEVDDTPWLFGTVGVEYDAGPWFAMGEVGWLDLKSVLGERLGGYVSGGYRFGPVTPYATYGRMERLHDTSADGLTVADLPPALAPTAAGLNAALNSILQSIPVQQNLTVGGRWDVVPGMALKLQVDFVDMLEGTSGTFINQQPEFERGGSAQLVSLATTFVF